MQCLIKTGVSARHIHLCKKDMEILFDSGSELHVKKNITQPGQFAAEEMVTLVTERSMMDLRVIGPLREKTQIELSMTDARAVGLTPPIRNSGDIQGTPGGKLIGKTGVVEINKGIIVAARHIHLCPETAAKYNLKDGQVVDVKTSGERSLTLHNVLVRAGNGHADEFHIDTDEANACGLQTGSLVEIIKKQ